MSDAADSTIPDPVFQVKFTEKHLQSFWAKVDIRSSDECWNWTRAKDQNGYGRWNGNIKSHRMSYFLHHGFIPKFNKKLRTAIMHKCDNPSCVNPNHLQLGTLAENSQDAKNKNRIRRKGSTGPELHPECMPRGSDHWSRKNPEKWNEVRLKMKQKMHQWFDSYRDEVDPNHKNNRIPTESAIEVLRLRKNHKVNDICKILNLKLGTVKCILSREKRWRNLDKYILANGIII